MIRRYNQLQEKKIEGLKDAEAKCRKLRMREVPWSQTLGKAMDVIALWKSVVSRKKGVRVSKRFISRLERAADNPNSLRVTLAQAEQNLEDAFK